MQQKRPVGFELFVARVGRFISKIDHLYRKTLEKMTFFSLTPRLRLKCVLMHNIDFSLKFKQVPFFLGQKSLSASQKSKIISKIRSFGPD